MAGSFGYELDLNQLDQNEKEKVAEQVKAYKEYQELIYGGKYYRLSNPKKMIWQHGSLFRRTAVRFLYKVWHSELHQMYCAIALSY